MQISKSKIKTLENCKLLFKWQYIDHRVPDIPPANITKIGIDIHDIFNHFYDNIKILEVPQNPYEYFVNSMKVLPQYQNIFNLFCKFQSRRWNLTENKEDFLPILKEHKINIDDMVGIIDATFYANKEYVVLDYKSSASNTTNLRFELNFYAKLLSDSKILDRPVKYISAYGYKDGTFFYEEINNRSYNTMIKKVDNFRKNDWQNMEYPKKIGFYCSWCEYINSCNKL